MDYPLSTQPTKIELLGRTIWEDIYPVTIRYADTMSVEDIKRFGMPTVGDAGIDRDMHMQNQYVVITIDAMVEYYKRGVTITLRNNSDSAVIYRVINTYLLAWHEQLDRGINIGDAPLDDLLLMDRFATTLYPQAQIFAPDIQQSTNLFGNLFGSQGYASRNSLFGKPTAEPVATEHASLAKLFSKSMGIQGKSSWR